MKKSTSFTGRRHFGFLRRTKHRPPDAAPPAGHPLPVKAGEAVTLTPAPAAAAGDWPAGGTGTVVAATAGAVLVRWVAADGMPRSRWFAVADVARANGKGGRS